MAVSALTYVLLVPYCLNDCMTEAKAVQQAAKQQQGTQL
jgi:hypothetical protein